MKYDWMKYPDTMPDVNGYYLTYNQDFGENSYGCSRFFRVEYFCKEGKFREHFDKRVLFWCNLSKPEMKSDGNE